MALLHCFSVSIEPIRTVLLFIQSDARPKPMVISLAQEILAFVCSNATLRLGVALRDRQRARTVVLLLKKKACTDSWRSLFESSRDAESTMRDNKSRILPCGYIWFYFTVCESVRFLKLTLVRKIRCKREAAV